MVSVSLQRYLAVHSGLTQSPKVSSSPQWSHSVSKGIILKTVNVVNNGDNFDDQSQCMVIKVIVMKSMINDDDG